MYFKEDNYVNDNYNNNNNDDDNNGNYIIDDDNKDNDDNDNDDMNVVVKQMWSEIIDVNVWAKIIVARGNGYGNGKGSTSVEKYFCLPF